ncbi:MAG: tetratricopeptide repeat protein [Cyanobacteria bacterium P01_F01_bin.150]
MLFFQNRPWQKRLALLSLSATCLAAVLGHRLWSAHLSWAIPYPYTLHSNDPETATQTLNQEIAFYRDRIQQSPSDGLDRAALAQTYLKMARATGQSTWYLLAEQSARQSLTNLSTNNPGATMALAQIAEAKHDFNQSIALAKEVLALSPNHEEAKALLVTSYLAIGETAKAHQIANQLVEQLPTLGSFTLRALTHDALCLKEDAIADFHQALALEEPQETGSSAWARTLLGRFYAEQGELAQAKQLYQDALRLVPRYPLALINLAKLETQQGHYRKAQQRYSRVFTSEDYPAAFDHVATQGLARIKLLQGDRQAAEEKWAIAEQQFRTHQDLDSFGHRQELARLLLTRGHQEDLPEALALMEQEITLRRDHKTLSLMAWVLSRQGQWDKAQSVIKEAIAQKSCHTETLYRAAAIEESLGNTDQAVRYQQQAQAINPAFDDRAQRLSGL